LYVENVKKIKKYLIFWYFWHFRICRDIFQPCKARLCYTSSAGCH